MKKLFSKILVVSSVALLMLSSCEKEETQVVATSGKAGVLSSSATTLSLSKPAASANAVTFTTTKADYGYQAAVSNSIQFAVKGTNFASPKEVALEANVLTKSYTVGDFNAILLGMSLPVDKSAQVEARIKTTISGSIAPIYSNVLTITATPYALLSFVYVPGAYQGWNPATADSLVSATSNGVYTGIIVFDGGNFKVTPAKKWDVAYGSAGGDKISTTGGDIASVSAGPKMVTVDLNANTIKLEAAKMWSIIGDATLGGWSTDTDMKSLNDGKNTWKITTNLVGGKEMKFRFNHDWGVNLGGTLTGLTNGGDNIKIAASGSYTITLTVTYDPTDATKVTGGVTTIVKN